MTRTPHCKDLPMNKRRFAITMSRRALRAAAFLVCAAAAACSSSSQGSGTTGLQTDLQKNGVEIPASCGVLAGHTGPFGTDCNEYYGPPNFRDASLATSTALVNGPCPHNGPFCLCLQDNPSGISGQYDECSLIYSYAVSDAAACSASCQAGVSRDNTYISAYNNDGGGTQIPLQIGMSWFVAGAGQEAGAGVQPAGSTSSSGGATSDGGTISGGSGSSGGQSVSSGGAGSSGEGGTPLPCAALNSCCGMLEQSAGGLSGTDLQLCANGLGDPQDPDQSLCQSLLARISGCL